MYISLKWVQDLIGIQRLTLDELVNRLTLTGFEIESIQARKHLGNKDFILDISFTANRGDISNIRGLITELITLFPTKILLQPKKHIKPLIFKTLQINGTTSKLTKKLYEQNNNFAPLADSTYSKFHNIYEGYQQKYYLWEWFLQKKSFSKPVKNNYNFNQRSSTSKKFLPLFDIIVNDIKIKESPYWIKKRLKIMGVNPLNNILDIIHYLMLETGQVFFTYDLDALKAFTGTDNLTFIPKYVNEQCQFSLSASKTINLPNNILTLIINDKIVSLVGLIQNFSTIITKETSNILIQAALYDPKEIKKSSRLLGLRTDYSIKLEKQTDLNLLEQSYLRLKHLFWTQNIELKDHTNKNHVMVENNFSLFSNSIKRSEKLIKLIYKNIKKVTGPAINMPDLKNSQILKTLKLLNFKVYFQTDEFCYISVPLARQIDIEREIDIIEEIVRVIGFNNFPAITMNKNQFGALTKIEKLKRRLRNYFLSLGFHESVHGTLIKSKNKDQIKLKNPIFNDSSVLRASLLEGLIEKVKFNQKTIGAHFEAFELGRIYKQLGNGNQQEIEVISGIFGGNTFRSNWDNEISYLSWFEAKGFLEILFEKLDISPLVSWRSGMNYPAKFHPNLTTDLFIGNHKLGVFGQIHPTFTLNEGLKTKLYFFEFNTEILNYFSTKKNLISYRQYSSYPISYLDLSFLVNKLISAEEIRQIIYKLGYPLLKTINIVDYYYNKPIKNGYCSLTFKLKFQSETRTLSTEEVRKITDPIICYLETHYDMKIQE